MKPLRWRKLGRVFDATRPGRWFASHAQNPTPFVMKDRIRVYCNVRPPRDATGNYIARVAYADLDPHDPTRVIGVSPAPVLPLGGKGEFDEFGTMVQSVVPRPDRGEIWMYYVGWTRKVSVPFDWAIGLAISRDGGNSFERFGRGPVVGPTPAEPFLHACPHVIRHGAGWRMWYGSGIAWQTDEVEPIYRLFVADSDDGIVWARSGRPVIPPRLELECQTTPSVLDLDGRYVMLFSYRHGTGFRTPERGYRIGCAVSDDLVTWSRDDVLAGLDPSDSGWDAEMVCYPMALRMEDGVLLFYCGNGFGKDGFGVARLRADGNIR